MKRNLPPLKSLPVFACVAKHLSFSKAADELSLTHSAVSQTIKQLEEFLGCKLFERNTSHVNLNKVGQRYLVDINAALNQIENTTNNVKQTAHCVSVNLMNSLALHWLIPNIPKFQQAHPGIKVDLSTMPKPLLISLDKHEVDMIITCQAGPVTDDIYHCCELFDDELILVASPKLVKKFNKKFDIKFLLKKSPAIYVDAPLRTKNWFQWCRSYKISEPAKTQRHFFSNTTQAIQAAISGIGLLVTHKIFVDDGIELNLLKSIMTTPVKTGKHYYLITLKERINEPNIKTYFDYIQNNLI